MNEKYIGTASKEHKIAHKIYFYTEAFFVG